MQEHQDPLFDAVEIEINSQCNLACSYCPNSVDTRVEKGQMNPELYKSIIAQLQELNFKGRIAYDFYNEPLLCRELPNFVKLTKEKLPQCRIEIFSNGTLLDEEMYKNLLQLGVDQFVITQHESIKHLKIQDALPNLSESEKRHLQLRDFTDLRLTNRGGTLKDMQNFRQTNLLPCHIPSMMLTITVNGSVVPCFEDFYQKNQMGNLRDEKLIDIWNKKEYAEMRRNLRRGLRHKYEACKACDRVEALRERLA